MAVKVTVRRGCSVNLRSGASWLALVLCCLFTALLSLPAQAAVRLTGEEAQPRIVRVGFPHAPGFSEILEDGTYSGMCYDYLMAVKQYVNWEYEFISVDPNRAMELLAAGELDILGGIAQDDPLADTVDYASHCSGMTYTTLSALDTNTSMDTYQMDSMNGALVGTYKAHPWHLKDLDTFSKGNGVEFAVRNYDNMAGYSSALEKGEVELILGGDVPPSENIRPVAWFSPRRYYFVTGKGNTGLMRELNLALSKLKDDRPNLDKDLYNKYFMPYSEMFLTDKERAYIESLPPLKAMGAGDLAPLQSAEGRSKKPKGLSIELLEYISQETGLKFDYSFTLNQPKAIEMLQTGDADIIFGVERSNDLSQNYDLTLSVSCLPSDKLCVRNANIPQEALSEARCALPVGYMPELDMDSSLLIRYDTISQCLKAVELGLADYTLVSSYVAEYYMAESDASRLALSGQMNTLSIPSEAIQREDGNFCFALPRNVNPMLLSIINKTLNSLPSSELDALVRNNMATIPHGASLGRLLRTNPSLLFPIILLFVVTCTMISITVIIKKQHAEMTETLKRQREYDEHIKDALTSAQSANKAKSEFLSHISHEIRTPLTGIIGMTQISLEEGSLPENVKGWLEKTLRSSDHLLSLINDILDMSRIENGRMTLDVKPFGTAEFFHEVYSIIGQMATAKGVNFCMDLRELTPLVAGDVTRIKQVLLNLLSNAVKFTPPEGEVKLIAIESHDVEDPADADSIYVKAIVRDSGIGMSEEFQKRAFQPFEQERGNMELAKNFSSEGLSHLMRGGKQALSGTGLGLAITRNLVEMMGGHIAMKSTLGTGTEIAVSLRLSRVKSEDSPEAPLINMIVDKDSSHKIQQIIAKAVVNASSSDGASAESTSQNTEEDEGNETRNYLHSSNFTGYRVLLAEDNEINLEIEMMILEKMGLEIDTASDGLEAVEKFRNSGIAAYSAILMDIQMPNMNGLEAAKTIRAMNRSDARSVPILAMTANAYSEDIAKSFASGMNAHITKPINPEELRSRLAKLIAP